MKKSTEKDADKLFGALGLDEEENYSSDDSFSQPIG